jgi:hypothetical protein
MDEKVKSLASFLKKDDLIPILEIGSSPNGIFTAYMLTWADGSCITINSKGPDRIIVSGLCQDACISGLSGHKIGLSKHRTSASWASAIMEKLLPDYFRFWQLWTEKKAREKAEKDSSIKAMDNLSKILPISANIQYQACGAKLWLTIYHLTEDQACNILEYISNEPILKPLLKGE